MEFMTLARQWAPQWRQLISETINVVLTLLLWPHQTIYMAVSQEKKKESLSLLLFCAVTVTLQGSFKCNFANLKCSILYCIINLVFHIPLIGFLKSIQIYQVALNSFYKETLNDTGSRKFFPSLRNSVWWHISSGRKTLHLSSVNIVLGYYCGFSLFLIFVYLTHFFRASNK